MVGLGVLFLSIVVLLEYLSVNKYRQKLSKMPPPFIPDPNENEDVTEER